MKCSELEPYWEDWLSGFAPPAVDRHLRECAECRALAEELARMPAWLAHARVEGAQPSPAFWTRLREQIEAREAKGDFWASLAWASARAAVALAVLVLLLAAALLQQSSQSAVAEFDGPQVYLEDSPGSVPLPVNGRLSRDQVVLTLVAQQEQAR
ncbi:MAG: anti-sigma factor family protein [Candidatus Acidiferrales bacterium]